MCLLSLSFSLSLYLTHTDTHFLLLTPISSSLNLRLAFRSAGSVCLQQLTPLYLQLRKWVRDRDRRYSSLWPLFHCPPLPVLMEIAHVCDSQKTTDPETLMTIRTCTWKNKRFVSGSCSSHACLCFSFSRRRRKGDGVLPWNETL